MTDELPVEETPRDSCVWCGEKIKQAGIGRRRRYCSGKCRQQASIAKKVREATTAAVAAALAERDQEQGDGPS